ncbi:MAG: hypothetical protein CMJ84_16045 [Planctomycetes bacterium]|nr:hypothetical protein [Planctomycetota bacterium]
MVDGAALEDSGGPSPESGRERIGRTFRARRGGLTLAVTSVLAASCGWLGEGWSRSPLVVVCVDGATWDVIDPMLERGELPNFRRLVERGARCDLITLPPTQSPVIWTTYATGVFPRVHNVLDFTYPYSRGGEKRPVEATERRAPAIWNVASDAGRSVGVVGYYVTEPAEVVNGFIVSDTLMEGWGGSTFPPELADELDVISDPLQPHPILSEFFAWDYDPKDGEEPTSPYQYPTQVVEGAVDHAVIRDENVRSASLRLMEREVDLFMAYSRIIDHASHRTWRYYDDTDFPDRAKATHRDLLDDVVPNAYRFVDRFLGELLERCGEDANVVVVSDHGFGSATGEYMIPDKRLARILTGAHRYDGILLAAGPDFREGTYEHVSLMDVAPLLMTLLDVPLSAELPGRVPREMLAERLLERGSLQTVERYESEWTFVDIAPASEEDDRRALEQLQALGYIDSSTKAGRQGPSVVEDVWSGDGTLKLKTLSGELLFLLMRDRREEAEQLMSLLTRKDPEAAKAMPFYAISEAKRVEENFPFQVFGQGDVARFLRPWVRR